MVFFLYQKKISLATIDRHQAGCLFLALLYDREKQKGNANRATLAVARKLVAYLVAIDRSQRDFLLVEKENQAAA